LTISIEDWEEELGILADGKPTGDILSLFREKILGLVPTPTIPLPLNLFGDLMDEKDPDLFLEGALIALEIYYIETEDDLDWMKSILHQVDSKLDDALIDIRNHLEEEYPCNTLLLDEVISALKHYERLVSLRQIEELFVK
jgi:hypothetical protein